jgi:hypothetical protein
VQLSFYGLNLLLAHQMNAAYAIVLSLFLIFNGGIGQNVSTGTVLHTRTGTSAAQHRLQLQKQSKVDTSNSDILLSEHEAFLISDTNDNPDTSTSGLSDFILLAAFYFFLSLRIGSQERTLPLCLSPTLSGTSKYLMYRSIRI